VCETLQVGKLANTPFSSSCFEMLLLYKINCFSKTSLFGLKAFRGICEEKNGWLMGCSVAPLGTEWGLVRCGEREGELNASLEGCRRHL